MKCYLHSLDKTLKLFLFSFIACITVGVLVGMVYLYETSSFSAHGAVERIRGTGDVQNDEFEIPEEYPKSYSELLMMTHNHIIGFSFIFLMVGGVFYFNSIITGWWKKFFLIEPLISTVVSFTSIFAIRYLDRNFVYLTVISSSFIYISFFVMVGVSSYELILKKEKKFSA